MKRLDKQFYFGFGYTAKALSTRLGDANLAAGTTRSMASIKRLNLAGFSAVIFDGKKNSNEVINLVSSANHILNSIPPDMEGDPVLRCFSKSLKNTDNLKWIGYLSTTGVYGDHDGEWVDETTPLKPNGKRGRRRAFTEDSWLKLYRNYGLPVHIFRLASIYGPGYSVIDRLRMGTARNIIKPNQVFSRIHIDDLVNVLLASIKNPCPGKIYNVCDDRPASPQEVIAYAAKLLTAPLPPSIDYQSNELTEIIRSFYADNKRVKNHLIKTDLRITLKYPTFREGLKAIAERNIE